MTSTSDELEPESEAMEMIHWHWDSDCPDCVDDDDALAGQAYEDDWTYHICPIRRDDEIVGYQVSGGDAETGDMLGWSNGGPLIEPTLAKAKAAAEASYAERCRDVSGLLDDYLDDGTDDDGLHIWRDQGGAVVCRVDEPDGEEVYIDVTLKDSGDYGGSGSVTLCLRTFLSCGGSRRSLIEEVRRLIRDGA